MANKSKSAKYQVGYGTPPKETQFKAGKSGNPSGRPKGSISLSTAVQRTSREQVFINENGRRKTITKLEAALKQVFNKAASGDLNAIRQTIILVRSAEEQVALETPTDKVSLGDTDLKVAQNILARFNRSHEEKK